MSEPLHYAAVPSPLVDGLEQLGSAPPSGSGRMRLDMSVNVWTLFALFIVLGIGLVALDRLNAQVEIQGIELKTLSAQQSITNERLSRMETGQAVLRRDLRNFPLHRHINGSRVEIYPPDQRESEEGTEHVRNR